MSALGVQDRANSTHSDSIRSRWDKMNSDSRMNLLGHLKFNQCDSPESRIPDNPGNYRKTWGLSGRLHTHLLDLNSVEYVSMAGECSVGWRRQKIDKLSKQMRMERRGGIRTPSRPNNNLDKSLPATPQAPVGHRWALGGMVWSQNWSHNFGASFQLLVNGQTTCD
jgi:hypothetical protein